MIIVPGRQGIIAIELGQSQIIEVIRIFGIQAGRFGQRLDGTHEVAHLHAGDAEQMMSLRVSGISADEVAVKLFGVP